MHRTIRGLLLTAVHGRGQGVTAAFSGDDVHDAASTAAVVRWGRGAA